MKYFDWDSEKNTILIEKRKISFEAVIAAVQEGYLLDILEHPNKQKYPSQKIMIVWVENYAYLVPFVEDDKKIFLKTVIPSRKATKIYRKENND